MAWQAISSTDIAVGKPITNTLLTKVKDSLDFLYGSVGAVSAAANLSNGSFEVDSDNDGTPDNWTKSAFSGGTIAIETTIRSHGDQCIKAVHPGGAGNGGGSITSDYITVATLDKTAIIFDYYCTAAGMKVLVEGLWYDEAEISLGTTTLYTSTSNPTAWTRKVIEQIDTYSGAYSLKVKFSLGYTDTDVAGTVYLDNVHLSRFSAPNVYVGAATVATETVYCGFAGYQSPMASEKGMEMPRAGVFRNLYGGNGNDVTVTLRRNSSDMGLSVTVANNNTTSIIPVVVGDLVSLKLVNSGSSTVVNWGIEFDPNVQ